MTELHHPGIDPAMARRNKRVAMAGLFIVFFAFLTDNLLTRFGGFGA